MPWLIQDQMTRADAATLGANWTNKANAPGIFSNAVDVTVTASENAAYYSSFNWDNDHYAQATAVVAAAAGRSLLVGVRLGSALDRSGYYAGSDTPNTGDNNRCLIKWNVGVWSLLASEAVAIAAADVLRLEAHGADILFYVNGSLRLSAVDTIFPTGAPGLLVNNGVADVALLDDFEAGDFNYQLGGLRVSEAANSAPVGGYSVA